MLWFSDSGWVLQVSKFDINKREKEYYRNNFRLRGFPWTAVDYWRIELDCNCFRRWIASNSLSRSWMTACYCNVATIDRAARRLADKTYPWRNRHCQNRNAACCTIPSYRLQYPPRLCSWTVSQSLSNSPDGTKEIFETVIREFRII